MLYHKLCCYEQMACIDVLRVEDKMQQKTTDHSFARVYMHNDAIRVRPLADDYIEHQLKTRKLKLSYAYSKGQYMSDGLGQQSTMVIKAGTPQLQQLMLQLHDDTLAFPVEAMVLTCK